jgi:hypothetical protein
VLQHRRQVLPLEQVRSQPYDGVTGLMCMTPFKWKAVKRLDLNGSMGKFTEVW